MIAPTASSIHRAEPCAGSCHLPHVGEPERDYQAAGSARHEFLQRAQEYGLEHALSKVPDQFREECEAIPVHKLPATKDGWAAEVAWAYNWQTGACRELGRGMSRDYSGATDDEIAGTADVVALVKDGSGAVVIDYKGPHADLPPVQHNLQVLTYALMAARCYGVDEVTIATVRIRPEESPYYDQAKLTTLELDAVAHRIRTIMERVRSADADDLAVGDHCHWCPAMRRCPAITGMMRGLIDEPVPEEFDEATERQAVENLKAAKDALKAYEENLRTYARTKAIDMGDGRVWGPRSILSQWALNTPEARAIVADALGEHAPDVTPDKITGTALKAAIKSHADAAKEAGEKPPSQKAQLEGLMETLGNAQQTRFRITTRFEKHTPPPEIGAEV